MLAWIQFVGPRGTLEIFGIRLVGFNAENGRKLLMSVVLVLAVMLVGRILRYLTQLVPRTIYERRVAFWTRQAIRLSLSLVLLLGLASIWFDDPTRLTTALGLVTAGLAFALQRVVTAIAGYFVILRGRTFTVGDRISMGGVRGDVIALGLIQTTIMEMGQPPSVQNADPAQWVKARQYSGRIVTVSNDKIFDTPVYNYSREFPYIWEEIGVPIRYAADRGRAEQILLDAATRHTLTFVQLSEAELAEMERRYVMKRADIQPRVYWRMTDNWLELAIRFLCADSGIREVKDAIARDVLAAFDEAGIEVASATFELVGAPPLRLARPDRTQ